MIKKYFKGVIHCLFYSFFNEVIEEQLSISIFFKIDDEVIKQTTMKHVPQIGSFIEISLKLYNEPIVFEVQKVQIMEFGSVAYLEGKFV